MISKYFGKEECVKTNTGLLNIMNSEEEENVKELCINVLDKVREEFGITICSSIFRSYEVNKRVGGVKTSHHRSQNGYAAADIIKSGDATQQEIYDFIKNNCEFCQLIFEPTWIHVSYNKNNNKKQCLDLR